MDHLRHSTYARQHQADDAGDPPRVAMWLVVVLALAMLALTAVTTIAAWSMFTTPAGPIVVTPTPIGPPGPNGGPQ